MTVGPRSPGRPALRGAIVVGVGVLVLAAVLAAGSGDPSRTAAGAPVVSSVRWSEDAAPVRGVGPDPVRLPTEEPTWINVTNASAHAAPPKAAGAVSAYDPLTNQTVYFGGCVQNGACPDNQTWVFAHGVWTNITDHTDAPPAREYAAMDYDANMQAILLFGGYGLHGPLNDTWTFQDGVWTNVSFYSIAPPARELASLAFDPQPEENGSVLFGGCVPLFIFASCDNDTWIWQGDSGWVELNSSVAPPIRGGASMAYDADGGYVVLFGGTNGLLTVWDDTWELYAGQWWNITPKSSPPADSNGALVYVPSLDGALLFGGFNASGDYVAQTWLFTGGGWFKQAPATSPPARADFDLALDATGTTPLLEGGDNDTTDFDDSWAYEIGPGALVGANVTDAEIGAPVLVQVTVGSGTPPYSAAVSFGDGSAAFLTGRGPYLNVTHLFPEAGTFVLSANVTDAVGATDVALTDSLTVTAGPDVVAQGTPTATDAGVPVAFSADVLAGGSAPLGYAWSFGDGFGSSAAAPSHAYALPGTYRITVNATDREGAVSTSSLTVVVAALPSLSVSSSPSSPGRGVETTFLANVSGGTAPYAFSWRFGDGSGSLLPTPQHWFNATGRYPINVWVNDSVGGDAHASWNVTVPVASFWGSLSGAPAWFWAALGGIAAVGIGGALYLLRTGRTVTPRR